MPYDLADPELAQFLRVRIRSDRKLSYEQLAANSFEMFGWAKSKSAEAINKWVDVPNLLTKKNADYLLKIAGLEQEWESRAHELVEADIGGFSYRSRSLGVIREMGLTEIAAASISMVDVARDVVGIDVDLFQEVGGESWVGSVDNWLKIMVEHPETWRVFLDERGGVVGYWMFVNPVREIFLEACLGNYPENEITMQTLRPLSVGPVTMYGPGMYIRNEITKKRERDVLGANIEISFLHHVRRLDRRGVDFQEVCVPVFSDAGLRIVKKFGLERMPNAVSARYAQRMGWPVMDQERGDLPALYYGCIDEKLRERVGFVPREGGHR